MFSLICTWTNDWARNRDAGDLRRHPAHYDVTVMVVQPSPWHRVMDDNWETLYCHLWAKPVWLNTLRPRQNGRHFTGDTFNRIFVKENARISTKFSLKFVPKGPINNIPALVQIMAWHRPGDKPVSEPVMVTLLTHICVTRPQWVKACISNKIHTKVWDVLPTKVQFLAITSHMFYVVLITYSCLNWELMVTMMTHRSKWKIWCNDDVIKWKHVHVTGPLCREFTGHRRIHRTKASDSDPCGPFFHNPTHECHFLKIQDSYTCINKPFIQAVCVLSTCLYVVFCSCDGRVGHYRVNPDALKYCST